MHCRNPYQQAPDFEALAHVYPTLKQHLIGHTINFQDEAAQRCLTEALLYRDFNLTVKLPSDRLCPPVPNRLNYVLWIQDVVRAHTVGIPRRVGNEKTVVHGVDIGTGASAIYPLLACTLEPSWRFAATEIDPSSFTYAEKHVTSNGLADRIRVVKVDAAGGDVEMQGQEMGLVFSFGHLFEQVPSADIGTECGNEVVEYDPDALTVEFTMCNPPFYSTLAEVEAAKGGWDKEEMPLGVCTGAPVEMITPGGEARFVGQMVRESVRERQEETDEMDDWKPRKRRGQENDRLESPALLLSRPKDQDSESQPTRCTQTSRSRQRSNLGLRSKWYTSMLGKLSSVAKVVDVIRGYEITNYAVTEFIQGQTRRWAVGWSFGAFRMPDVTSRIEHPNPALQRLLPPRNTVHFTIPESFQTSRSYDSFGEVLWGVLSSIEDAVVEERGQQAEATSSIARRDDSGTDQRHLPSEFLVRASRDSWSRSARRKRGRGDIVGSTRESLPTDKNELETVTDFFASAALVCTVRFAGGELEPGVQGQGKPLDKVLRLEFQWVCGRDRGLFESFVSHVGRGTMGG